MLDIRKTMDRLLVRWMRSGNSRHRDIRKMINRALENHVQVLRASVVLFGRYPDGTKPRKVAWVMEK